MTTVEHRPPMPVRVAAVVFALYGLVVLGNATVWQTLAGWTAAGDYPRAVVRLVGMLAVAWGLWRGYRWAWWMAVGLGGFWLVAGFAALALAARLAGDRPSLPAPVLVPALLGAALLAAGVALLLLPASRSAFRRPGAPGGTAAP